jgi:hypothetical protein
LVAIPLASKSDPAKREVVTSETLVNLYASKSPSNARSEFYLTRTPGLTAWSRNSSDICRGMFACGSFALGLFGSTLFKFNLNAGATSVSGSISGTEDVMFSRNNAGEVTITTNGGTAYKYTEAGGLATLPLSGIPAGPLGNVNLNGITLYYYEDRRVFYSDVNDTGTVNALNFFTVPGVGNLRAAAIVSEKAMFLGEQDSNVFNHDAADADDPFKLVKGLSTDYGCINNHAHGDVNGIYCYVDQFGMSRAIFPGSTLPQPIGNEGVVADINALVDTDDVRVWGYAGGDRSFAIIYTSEICWCHDFKELRWHNRQTYQRTTWQAKYAMRFAGKNLVAPDMSGGVFYLDENNFTEDGEHLVWEATSPPVTNFPNGGTVNWLKLDIEVGTAQGGEGAAEDQNPQITMFISKNAGKTWSTGRQAGLGPRGRWQKSVRWNLVNCAFDEEGFVTRYTGSAAVAHGIMNQAGGIKERSH